MSWTVRPRRASDETIAAYRELYVRGQIEVEDLERGVERALLGQMVEHDADGRPAGDEWLRLAVEAHRRAHTS